MISSLMFIWLRFTLPQIASYLSSFQTDPSKNPTSRESVEQALKEAGYDQGARNVYRGWYIGGAALDIDDIKEGIAPGGGLIFLIQK